MGWVLSSQWRRTVAPVTKPSKQLGSWKENAKPLTKMRVIPHTRHNPLLLSAGTALDPKAKASCSPHLLGQNIIICTSCPLDSHLFGPPPGGLRQEINPTTPADLSSRNTCAVRQIFDSTRPRVKRGEAKRCPRHTLLSLSLFIQMPCRIFHPSRTTFSSGYLVANMPSALIVKVNL